MQVKFIIRTILLFIGLLLLSVVFTLILFVLLRYIFSVDTSLEKVFREYYYYALLGTLSGALVELVYKSNIFTTKK